MHSDKGYIIIIMIKIIDIMKKGDYFILCKKPTAEQVLHPSKNQINYFIVYNYGF